MTIKAIPSTLVDPVITALQDQFSKLIKDLFTVAGGSGALSGQSWIHAGASEAVVFPADATDLPTVIQLANALRAAWLAHLANADAHKVADTTTTLAAPVATDQTSVNTLINEIKSDMGTHLASTTFHGVADGTNTVPTADATNLATSLALANAIKPKFNAHTAAGMTAGAVRQVPM